MRNKIFTTLGASNHVLDERAYLDYYATHPTAIDLLFEQEDLGPYILEPACGDGYLSKRMEKHGKIVQSCDIIRRTYDCFVIDFFKQTAIHNTDIVTNPPYKCAQQFIEHAISIIDNGRKVVMFLKLQFLEGKARKTFFSKYPPKIIYISSSRIPCAKNGDFDALKKSGGSAMAYAWYVWEKGYDGHTIVKWIN